MSRYLKSLTALFTGVVGWGAFVVASAPAAITAPEWIMLLVAVGTALGVYAVPNKPEPSQPNTVYQYIGSGTTTTEGATTTTVAPRKPPPVKPVKKTAPRKAKP